jgi:hypothetical protein
MIAHVWNEIEHDIGYKPEHDGLSEDEKFHLKQLGLLVRQGDNCITALMSSHEHSLSGQPKPQETNNSNKPFIDLHDFVSKMRDFDHNAMPKFAENSGQLFDLLTDIGLTSPQAISETLSNFDRTADTNRLIRLNEDLSNTGLNLDQDTSDLMLIALIERKKSEVRAALKGRAGRGKGRPSRLHRIAMRYLNQD